MVASGKASARERGAAPRPWDDVAVSGHRRRLEKHREADGALDQQAERRPEIIRVGEMNFLPCRLARARGTLSSTPRRRQVEN